jgi:16S rRNA (cytosine967-C5)-methyltransferase
MEHEKFCESFFIQPDLFLRLRPGHEDAVKRKLTNAGISFESISETCFALPNSTKIESVIDINKEAVVQDLNSQMTGTLLKSEIPNLKSEITAWDCCAASGGKSIMLYDYYYPGIELTVSDIRPSIIANLKKRFEDAGIKNYKPAIVDLTDEKNIQSSIFNNQYSTIICDAPCTGSGTWSRTPEQRYFFNHLTIEQFSHQQKKIVSNILPYLRPGGYLLYITCSVFKKENEEVIETIQNEHSLQLIKMELLKGYDRKADTLFAALLRKSL